MIEGSQTPTPHSDLAHTLQLLRDLAIINARTVQELGPLPPGGLPMTVKRKPDLPRPARPPAPLHVETEEDETMTWNPITATTAFAIAGTLAACAAEPSPPMDSFPASISEPAAVETQADTPPVAAQPSAVADPKKMVASEQPEPEYGPAIPAAQLRQQILELIGSFQTLQDLERAHVEAIIGMSMTRIDGMRDGYYYTATTTAGWLYRVEVARLGPLREPPTILVYLNNGVEPWTDQKPTYCTLDFEDIAKNIVALGYDSDDKRSTFGNKPSWGFGKDSPENNTGFGVSVYLYYIEDGTELGHACVKSLRIGGSSLHE